MGNDFDFLFYLDWLAKAFVTEDGGSAEGFGMFLGDKYQCGVKILERGADGVAEVQKKVRAIKASVGWRMIPPTAGAFSVKFTNGAAEGTTAAIAFGATADQFATACVTAIDADHANLTFRDLRLEAPGCWVFGLNGVGLTEPLEIEVVSNTLRPASFVRVRPYQESGAWLYEIRLIQSALAFSGAHERVLPAAPSIKQIKTGAPRVPGSSANTNEVQSIVVPTEFRGTYHIEWNYRTSRILGIEADLEEMAKALNEMFDDGQTRFLVTNPVEGEAYVEFVGQLAESDQPDMVVVVDSFPPGTLRFTLDCDKEELAAALRVKPVLTDVPFELELRVVDNDQDPDDPEVPGRKVTFQTLVTLTADAIYDELQARNPIDWLRPPKPKTYVPVSPDQVIVGQQNFEMAFGDPDALSYVFEHSLDTAAGWVAIRTNDGTGRVLGQGTEYSLEQTADDITVHLLTGPLENGLVLTFLAAGPKATFLAHTHSIGEITGLQALLNAHAEAIAEIQDRLPFTSPAITAAGEDGKVFPIREKRNAFPGKFPSPQTGSEPVLPTKTGALLPALHDATVTETDLSVSPPNFATAKGNVYKHTGTPTVTLPGVRGHKSPAIKTGEYVGCDGRGWYAVTREGTTNSWYATDMAVDLFTFPVPAKMLRPGMSMRLDFSLATQMLATEVAAQYLLVVDVGVPRGVTTPSPVGINLKDVVWNESPILSQQVIISSLLVETEFGAEIRRALDNAFTANAIYYGAIEAANDGIPAGANFVLRGRLIESDVVDDVEDPRGSIYYAFTQAKVTVK